MLRKRQLTNVMNQTDNMFVGRNTNLLIGLVIDNRGVVPDADVRQFAAFGNRIRHQFGREIKEVCNQGNTLTMDIG